MTDQPGSDDTTPGGAPTPPADDTPWWSRPSGETWDAPAPTSGTAYDETPVDATGTAPDYTSQTIWSAPDEHSDTLGNGQERAPRRRGTALVAGAAAIALVAGGAGGAVGYVLADHNNSSVTIDGANLGAAPARSVQRPAGSVPNVAADVLPSVVQVKVNTA
jgi:putative serine protease PepD